MKIEDVVKNGFKIEFNFTKDLYGFFQIRGDIRRAIIILSKITHWSLSEILKLTEEEFCLFYDEAILTQKEENS